MMCTSKDAMKESQKGLEMQFLATNRGSVSDATVQQQDTRLFSEKNKKQSPFQSIHANKQIKIFWVIE